MHIGYLLYVITLGYRTISKNAPLSGFIGKLAAKLQINLIPTVIMEDKGGHKPSKEGLPNG